MQIYGGRTHFWQWDLDQKLTSNNLKEGDKVHFSNAAMCCKALVCVAYDLDGMTVVDVPNSLLQRSLPITVYRMEDDGDSGYHTQETTVFDVKQRSRPDDYVYTETEIFSYAKLEKRVKALEDREPSGGGEEVIAKGAVLYTEQELTEKQQMQARKNLGLYHATKALTIHQVIDMDNECKIVERYLFDQFVDGEAYLCTLGGHEFKSVQCSVIQTGPDSWATYVEFAPNTDNLPPAVKLYYDDSVGIYGSPWNFTDGGYDLNFSTGLQTVKVFRAEIQTIPEEYIPGKLLPSPTEDIEGQIPCVVGGEWTTVPLRSDSISATIDGENLIFSDDSSVDIEGENLIL